MKLNYSKIRVALFLLTALLSSVVSQVSKGQSVDYGYVKKIGGTGTDNAYAVAVDAARNTYVTGSFTGTMQIGAYLLTSKGSYDLFLIKYDKLGHVIWAKSAGGSGVDYSIALALDANGSVYIAGNFNDTLYVEDQILASNGLSDAFLIKYTALGEAVWGRKISSTSYVTSKAIAADAEGNVYMTGAFKNVTDFGGTTVTSSGENDLFIARYLANGRIDWVKTGGSSAFNDSGIAIATDTTGACVVTGNYEGVAFLEGQYVESKGAKDVIIAKFTNAGNMLWLKTVGGISNDEGTGIAANSYSVYLTGSFTDSATFGNQVLLSRGNTDVYICKLNSSTGNFNWARRAGGTELDQSTAIALDNEGNSYITGYFTGTTRFGGTNVISVGGTDIFVAEYNAQGGLEKVIRAGGEYSDHSTCISVDLNGHGYIAGDFNEEAKFGSTTLTSAGAEDSYLFKVNLHPPVVAAYLEGLAPKTDFVVYPNPTTGNFNLLVESNMFQQAEIRVVDITGKTCRMQNLNLTVGMNQLSMQVAGTLAPGLYIVQMQLAEQLKTVRLSVE